MNSNYCPVKSSADRYYAALSAEQVLDDAIEREKAHLWENISAETIAEVLCEVPDKDVLFIEIRNLIKQISLTGRCNTELATGLCKGLFCIVDDHLENVSVRLIKERKEEDERYKEWSSGGYHYDYR